MIKPFYLERQVDSYLVELFEKLPAILITGPRAAGKTTTAKKLVVSTNRLDVPAEAGAFHFDPDATLAVANVPVLLDEWQEVPELMGAVKRAIDNDSSPGRYILTGSPRAARGKSAWSGIGRVTNVVMYGLTVMESMGRGSQTGFLERLSKGSIDIFPKDTDPPDLVDYIELAIRGGFPEAVINLDTRSRQAWLETYVNQLFSKDVFTLDSPRNSLRLSKYFEALCLNSAGLAEDKTIHDAAGITRLTGKAYEQLLSELFVYEAIPAWANNKLTRLVRSQKRYITDSSLIPAALKVDQAAILKSSDLIGRLLDTFVVSQLRPEREVSRLRPRFYHLRERDGRREIDLVIELSDGSILGIEIKASSSVSREDSRHLSWLRDIFDTKFIAGAVIHTGPRPFVLDDRIFALPIYSIWN